ncbi:DUF6493 family protein [Micromonospora sp. WMMD956]|uniref:DUF6493 family protein n=1 Tax=Micromonospora sp. WMMD956 TaxID=3016108 RepID=UPI0024178EC2|nr:DUF6493 family protein [Micromonospora sp. WMMD956]MDG4819231.1 DUF6493 family protein [Micromonospora sp. WMMD956]
MKSTVRRRWELAAGGSSDLFDLVDAGSADLVAAALTGLPEQRRRAVGVELTEWFKTRRSTFWGSAKGTALAVAVVGCLPTAAQAAALLSRRSVAIDGDRAARLVRVVAVERGIDWLPELARRLADKLTRDVWLGHWRFVAGLLPADAAPPTGERFVELWVQSLGMPDRRRGAPVPLVDRLRADPLLPALLPRLFEIDGLGGPMMFDEVHTDWENRRRHVLPTALAQLAAEGVVDRAALLDGALGRLLRGDRPAALRAFTVLLHELQPTSQEVAARATDYLRLLADAPAPVAVMAQKALRALPDPEPEAVLAASREVLLRPDKALVRGQLAWLDRLVRRHPDRAAQIAEVIAVAAGHPAVDVRDRAAALTARHGPAPAAADAAPAAEPASAGGPAVAGARGDDLPHPGPPAPAPAPITDLDELTEEVAALVGTEHRGEPLDRILDGLVRLAPTDGPRLRAALDPVLARRHWAWANEHTWDPCCLCGLVSDLLETAGVPRPAAPQRGRWAALLAAVRRPGPAGPARELTRTDPRVPAPHALLRARLAEIGHHLGEPGHPGLLAAPTSANGALDPLALLERLTALGERQPWRWDLTQALLRLPTGVDDTLAGKAEALRTPAGDRMAAWLRAGGLPDPVARLVPQARRPRRVGHDWEHGQFPPRRIAVELRPPAGHPDPYGLLTVDPPPMETDHATWARMWPSVLPHHLGVVAAYVLPQVTAAADLDRRDGALALPLLAECGGTGGPAVDVALAYGLAARHGVDRVAALDALLGLAATGRLDAAGVGARLGDLGAGQLVKLTRAVEPLRDAAGAGAPRSVWRLLAAALPPLLAAPTPPRGLPDLLTLAAETATATGARVEVPGLAEVAGRGGSSRVVTEARRLHRALTAG